MEEKTISSQRIYEGSIINLRRDKVSLSEDRHSFREIVEHKGGVAVAAINSDGKMVLVRQYRKAIEKVLYEVPAGKMDKVDEDSLEAIKRELKEETGYTAGNMVHLTSFYTSVGFSNEIIHLYYATDLVSGEPCPEENEDIETSLHSISELTQMIKAGDIQDAKTIIAILMAQQILLGNK